jgi:hypothetical protein
MVRQGVSAALRRCPVCGELFDCRDLNQVMEHLHGGKVEMVEIFEPPTRRT